MDKKGTGIQSIINGIIISVLVVIMLYGIVSMAGNPKERDKSYLAKSVALDGIDALAGTKPEANVQVQYPAFFTGYKVAAFEGYVQVVGEDANLKKGTLAKNNYPYAAKVDALAYSSSIVFSKQGEKIDLRRQDNPAAIGCPVVDTRAEVREQKIFVTGHSSPSAEHLKRMLTLQGFKIGDAAANDMKLFLSDSADDITIKYGGEGVVKTRSEKLACFLKNEIEAQSDHLVSIEESSISCSSPCVDIAAGLTNQKADYIYVGIVNYYS